jgi:hypothetical protein
MRSMRSSLARVSKAGNIYGIRYFSDQNDWNYIGKFPPTSMMDQWIMNYMSTSNIQHRYSICKDDILEGGSRLSKQKLSLLNAALSNCDTSIRFAMMMRSDVQSILNSQSKDGEVLEGLLELDSTLSRWLSAVLCNNALVLRRVLWEECSGGVLEKVANGEAVHRIRSLSQLKNRFSHGRRCFVLIHPWYVHICLCHNYRLSDVSI